MGDSCYVLYCHTNKVNGKKYFGITNNIKRRWAGNGIRYSEECLFGKAIKKYGWGGFSHDIVLSGLTREDAAKFESMYISKYKTNVCRYKNDANGYNMTDGGDGANGYTPTEDVIQKRANAILGRERPDMVGNTFRKGYSAWNKGKPWDDDTRNKMAEINQKRCNKPVVCIENNTIYESVTYAAKIHNICKNSISGCCTGKYKSASGLHWRFASDIEIDNYKQTVDKKEENNEVF